MFKVTINDTDTVRYFASRIQLDSYCSLLRCNGYDCCVEPLSLNQTPNNSPQSPHQANDSGSHRPIGC